MNITILGFDYYFSKILSELLAKRFNLEIIDIKDKMDKILLLSNGSIFQNSEACEKEETNLIKTCVKKDNVVLVVPEDTIFSNKNYKYLKKNNIVVFVNSKANTKTQEKLKKFIKNIKVETSRQDCDIEQIIYILRGYDV